MRDLRPSDAGASARLHEEVLGMEFLARFGPRLLGCYHRAWIASPAGIAIGAFLPPDDRLAGVMLGATAPAAHFKAMVRHDGVRLVVAMAAGAAARPALARELVVTRAGRYARGVGRIAASALKKEGVAAPAGPRIGEVTHLMVSPAAQGGGIGRLLLSETARIAREAGVDELVLVTPPDLAAGDFYRHLGWIPSGSVRSRSGEDFVRFRFPLA